MATHVALLRGINVGGRNKLAMADLRQVVASLGHSGVATYIQSGNVVFTAGKPDAGTGELAAELTRAIAETCGVEPAVVVLTCEELVQVVRDNPFPAELNLKYVHAVFLPAEPDPGAGARIAAAVQEAARRGGRDEARLAGRTLFLHTPDGLGRSILAELLLSRASGPAAAGTARNWATVTKLLALCGS
jgi:uncharacterized protein (DUF1697 family)